MCSLPCRQLRNQRGDCPPRLERSLPCRQLRKVLAEARGHELGSLPCRQLRKRCCSPDKAKTRSLPCRQLRNRRPSPRSRPSRSLPCRQLRNSNPPRPQQPPGSLPSRQNHPPHPAPKHPNIKVPTPPARLARPRQCAPLGSSRSSYRRKRGSGNRPYPLNICLGAEFDRSDRDRPRSAWTTFLPAN